MDELRSLGLGARALVRRGLPLIAGLGLGLLGAWLADRRYGSDSAVDAAVFAAIAGLGLTWNIILWVRRARRQQADVAAQISMGMESALQDLVNAFHTVVRTPTLVWVFVGGAMISFGMNGIIGWAPAFMTRELGLSVAKASILLGKWGLVFGIAGTLSGGFLADWLQKRHPWARVTVSSIGFLLGGPLAIWLLTIRDLSVFTPVFCAAFFFLTWYNGPLTSVIFDVIAAADQHDGRRGVPAVHSPGRRRGGAAPGGVPVGPVRHRQGGDHPPDHGNPGGNRRSGRDADRREGHGAEAVGG